MFDDRILNGLSVFMSVVESGSFGKAADAVGITKSGVSRAIARLEDRTGIRLFDRTSRALKLTDEGRLFYDQALPLIQGLERLTATGSGLDEDLRGRLRVNADAAFGHYFLAPKLGDLQDRYPNLHIDLLVRDRIGDLIAEGIDIAVRFGVPDGITYERRLLFESKVITCASATFLERHGRPSTVEELLDDRFRKIRMLDPASGQVYPWHLTSGGKVQPVEPRSRIVLNDAGTILAALRAGVGIARALDFTVVPYLDNGELVEVLPECNHMPWPAYVYYPRRAYPSPAVQAFVTFVSDLARVDPQPIMQWLSVGQERVTA